MKSQNGFIEGGGETGALLRGMDWSTHALGDPRDWPSALKAVVGLTLAANQPMFVAWGSEQTLLYNDDYASLLVTRHPGALGKPFFDAWPELREEVGPIIQRAYDGHPTAMDDIELKMFRRGYEEEVHFSFFYAPIRDDDGTVGGIFCACTDITDKVLSQRRIAAESARHRRLFDIAPGYVAVLNGPDFEFEFVNRSFRRLFGNRDLVGKRVEEALPETMSSSLREVIALVYPKGGRHICHEVPFDLTNDDGSTESIRLDFVFEALLDESDKVTGVFMQGSDSTIAFHTKADLRQSGERFKAAVEAIGVMWTATHDGRMAGEQSAWAQLTGQVEKDYTDFGWAQVIHPDDAESTLRAWKTAVETKRTFVFEHRVKNRQGEWRTFSIRAVPVLDHEERVREWVGVHIDITEQREAQRALTELNRSLEERVAERTAERDTMWKLSEDLLYVMDTDGRIKAASPAAKRVLGFAPEDLIGHLAREWLHPDELPGSESMRSRVLTAPVSVVNRIRTADDDYRSISWRAVEERGIVYAVGRDVTEELRAAAALETAEAAARQSQKMEAVGYLTGGIAHDFNNLLQTISASFQLIRTRNLESDLVKGWAAKGLESVERGTKLTSQLLTFSRNQELKLERRPLNELLNGMSDLLARTIGPTVQFAFETEATQSVEVFVDSAQLEVAIVNLCLNARDAMPDGGYVKISSSLVDAWPESRLAPGRYAEVRVIDSGSGMTPDVLKNAFNPFFSTKPVGRGTGLGLAQVYGFVHQVGGSARIESRVGAGTTLSLLLPATEGERNADQQARHERDASRPIDILVVEDDGDIRELLHEFLEAEGYVVRSRADGAAGLVALIERKPDLLITDYAMPVMNGAQLVTQALERFPEMPVIFMTGYADSADLREAAGKSATVLRKPVDVLALVSVIESKMGVGGSLER